MGVTLSLNGDVAVIAIDSPSVNALGIAVREGLMAALAGVPDSTRAVVLHGTVRAFSGGADITEFGKPGREPALRQVIAAIEEMAMPVVAAIEGVAFGGGLELALECYARVAWAAARMGLPEVKLGLLPGGGGTQRLPRVVGVERALRMIVTGAPVGAEEALGMGLLDAVLTGECPGVAWARGDAPRVRVRDREEALAPARADAGLVDRVAAVLLRGSGRDGAAAVRRGGARCGDDGVRGGAGERAAAVRAVDGGRREPGAAACVLRRAGGAEGQAASGDAGQDAGGAGGGGRRGDDGRRDRDVLRQCGIPVLLIEMEAAALERGMARIEALYAASAKRGSVTAAEGAARFGRIVGQVGLSDLQGADIVVEAVFEEIAVKQEVFRRLDALARPGAVLATNTSYLDIDAVASVTSRPGDVLGMHFFSPANVMRLLEVVRGAQTAPAAIATAQALGKRLGKVPVVVGNCFGFMGNRMLARRTERQSGCCWMGRARGRWMRR